MQWTLFLTLCRVQAILLGSSTWAWRSAPARAKALGGFTGFIWTTALTSCFLSLKLALAGCKFAGCTPYPDAASFWFDCICDLRSILRILGIYFLDSKARLHSLSRVEIISGVGFISSMAILAL